MGEMTQYPFQATVVGKDMVPENPRKEKWAFLDSMSGTLNPGQAIRLVIPKGQTPHGAISVWRRLLQNKGATPHNRMVKKADGSRVVYLWYGK